MAGISVYAHRGGLSAAPENTVAAFKLALAYGASAVECDIRRTADGQFVAFHDADASRVCGRDWKIAATAWPHLKSLRVQGREPIAHLDDVLNLMILRPGKDFYFELALERPSDAADLALQIKRAGMEERAFLLTFQHRTAFLEAARRAVPRIGTAIMPFLPRALPLAARRAGVSKVCAGWLDWPLTKQLFFAGAGLFDLAAQVREAELSGVEISAGIANHPREVRRLIELGVKSVWTDDVRMAARYT